MNKAPVSVLVAQLAHTLEDARIVLSEGYTTAAEAAIRKAQDQVKQIQESV